jgi:hypothetical protein
MTDHPASRSNALPASIPAFSGNEKPGWLLAEKVKAARLLLPTPAERVLQPDQDALDSLAAKIAAQPDNRSIRHLAVELTGTEVAMLFPLLGMPDTNSRLAGKIQNLIEARACPSLYASGWAIWQHVYPHPAVARTLAALCRILAHGQKHGRKSRPNSGGKFQAGLLPPMINQILSPDSHLFVNHLVDRIIRLDTGLETFFREYQVKLESPLGLALGVRFFLVGPTAVFVSDKAILAKILNQIPLSGQAALISRFLAAAEIDPVGRNQVSQLIYSNFGAPDAAASARHPVWHQSKPQEIKIFQRWVIAATIGSHCRDHPQRARFYLDYAQAIEKLERWDNETLLIHFPGFTLADSRSQPGLAMYYDPPQPGGQPFGFASRHAPPGPASKSIPHRQIDDAVRVMNFRGVIGLPFDEEGIQLSRIFLDLRLKEPVNRSNG